MGLILAVLIRAPGSQSAGPCNVKPLPKECVAGLELPLQNEGGFNSTNVTTNVTTAPVERKRIQWNGTWTRNENFAGFGPPPEDEENSQ
ncbi:hypothetical protein D9C73_021695 [Collichthys lucidus]|uniref:Uncharacterized protein n=1 Tax=Collichthys lucidus TaxID=240159 RepID=A0A4U5VID8_COLLU|nr:hypothetical protein D9C73_021695 [Collichthys lucidus]